MAPNVTPHDAEIEMAELEMEEHRILRELKEMDDKVNDSTVQKKRHTTRDEPKQALNSLLSDCESEVREAKGYISSTGPPLRIARCKRGEGVPAHATYLSRPKGTGVDFTVPVTLKEYSAVVKHPIFLNGVRDKCSANKYNSPDEYIADMKLLSKNTAAFNKGPELAWVVQHAKLLLECAEEAVRRRNRQFNEIMSALGSSGGSGSRRVAGKRKRSSSDANGSTSHPGIGTTIQVYWEHDRKWYQGVIRDKSGSEVQILYENDSNPEWLDLNGEAKWRLPAVRSKRIENASKRKKGSSTPSVPTSRGAPSVALPANVVTRDDLTNLREDLLAAVDDSKQVMLNTLQASTVSIENKLNRSDALHRVLLAVSDMQASVEGRVDGLQKLLDDVTISVSALAKHVNSQEYGSRSRSPSRNENHVKETGGEKAPEEEPEKNVDVAKEVVNHEETESSSVKDKMEVAPSVKEKGTTEATPSEKDCDEGLAVMDESNESLKEVKRGENEQVEPASPKSGDKMNDHELTKKISEHKETKDSTSMVEKTDIAKEKPVADASDFPEKKSNNMVNEDESKDEVGDSEEAATEELEIEVEEGEDEKLKETEMQMEYVRMQKEDDKEKQGELVSRTDGEDAKGDKEFRTSDDTGKRETERVGNDEIKERKVNGVNGDVAKEGKEVDVNATECDGTKPDIGLTSLDTQKRPKAAKDEEADDSSSSSESSSGSSSSSSDDDEEDDERGEKTKRGDVVNMDIDSVSSPPPKSLEKVREDSGDDK